MKQFVITLGQTSNHTLVFDLLDTDIANRWAKEIGKDYPLYETNRFKGWPNSTRSYPKELQEQIDIVNAYKSNTIPNITVVDQESLNILHKHFEDLRGDINVGTEFYNSAPSDVRSAVDKFNVVIHEYEHHLRHSMYPEIVGTYKNRIRYGLIDDDYELFTFKWKFGYVYINYCEVGKPILDVFKDQDDHVGINNIKPLNYYSADFVIKFGPDTPDTVYEQRSQALHKWIIEKGLNKFDYLSLGLIPVAKLNYADSGLADLSQQDIVRLLSQYQWIQSTCIR